MECTLRLMFIYMSEKEKISREQLICTPHNIYLQAINYYFDVRFKFCMILKLLLVTFVENVFDLIIDDKGG